MFTPKKTALLVTSSLVMLSALNNGALAQQVLTASDAGGSTIKTDASVKSGVVITTATSGTPTVTMSTEDRAVTLNNDGKIRQTGSGVAIAVTGATTNTNNFTLNNGLTGEIYSASDHAIDFQTGVRGNIIIKNDGKITAKGSGNFAIEGSSSLGKMTINNTGTISGGIRLSTNASGSEINFNGGQIIGNGAAAIDGTRGRSDTLNFNGNGTGTKKIFGGKILDIENINVKKGTAYITSDIGEKSNSSFIHGTDNLTVNNGATLILDNDVNAIGNLIVNGTMSLINPTLPSNNNSIGTTVTGNFDARRYRRTGFQSF